MRPNLAPGSGGPLLRFVAVSGLGWVIDSSVYTVLVALGSRVLWSSIAGGLCGASFAFLTSSRVVFASTGKALPLKLLAYLAYTLALILVAAVAVEFLTRSLIEVATALAIAVPLTIAAFTAKCLITPVLLATNFLVSRRILANH